MAIRKLIVMQADRTMPDPRTRRYCQRSHASRTGAACGPWSGDSSFHTSCGSCCWRGGSIEPMSCVVQAIDPGAPDVAVPLAESWACARALYQIESVHMLDVKS
jgi:hypothetical protein